MFKSISRLKKYLWDNPCQIIHTQTPFGGVIGRLAAKKFRKSGQTRVIYFVHGFHFFKGASIINYLIYYNIEKYLARFTDCLITLNHEDYEAALKFRAKSVEYVPGVGVNTDYIQGITADVTAKKHELGIPADKKVILTVAELIPRKNIEASIRAFAGTHNTDCTMLICGKGELLDELKLLCKSLGVSERVIFAGYRTDILEIYKITDIFLFTSYQEGLPVAVMQAMASGLPVIASDIRGNRDLIMAADSAADKTSDKVADSVSYKVADNSIRSLDCLTDVNNIDEFTDKLNRLLKNPEICTTLGQRNVMACQKHFDIAIVHEQMTKIYNNLLNS